MSVLASMSSPTTKGNEPSTGEWHVVSPVAMQVPPTQSLRKKSTHRRRKNALAAKNDKMDDDQRFGSASKRMYVPQLAPAPDDDQAHQYNGSFSPASPSSSTSTQSPRPSILQATLKSTKVAEAAPMAPTRAQPTRETASIASKQSATREKTPMTTTNPENASSMSNMPVTHHSAPRNTPPTASMSPQKPPVVPTASKSSASREQMSKLATNASATRDNTPMGTKMAAPTRALPATPTPSTFSPPPLPRHQFHHQQHQSPRAKPYFDYRYDHHTPAAKRVDAPKQPLAPVHVQKQPQQPQKQQQDAKDQDPRGFWRAFSSEMIEKYQPPMRFVPPSTQPSQSSSPPNVPAMSWHTKPTPPRPLTHVRFL
ncbi:hypothetical protein BC940DRAFT_46958 [Gongronella butleri]|nr:hypothetical protein BC940DRAFT_46958 [Gongronella butleri]